MIGSSRPRRPLAVVILLAIVGAGTACSRETPQPIVVRDIEVIVQNQTTADWTGVEVWVNDHFRGVAPALNATQQLVVPLSGLVGPYGQRFDVRRQPVFGVLVKARSADGHDVRLTWGKVRRQ